MNRTELRNASEAIMRAALRRHLPAGAPVCLYGSRARGDAAWHSDYDLWIDADLPQRVIADIHDELASAPSPAPAATGICATRSCGSRVWRSSRPRLRYRLMSGEQIDDTDAAALRRGTGFLVKEDTGETYRGAIQSRVHYDLIGRLATETQLTRRTVGAILHGLQAKVFGQYPLKPEDFIQKAATLINEQKATAALPLMRSATTSSMATASC